MKVSVLAEVNSQQIQIFPPKPFHTRTHFYCAGLFRFLEMFFLYGFSFYFLPSDQGRHPLVHGPFGPVPHSAAGSSAYGVSPNLYRVLENECVLLL